MVFGNLRYLGKAKATDKDEFEEEFGKRLAKTRAQKNAFKIANKAYNEIGDVLYKLVFRDFLCID